VPLGWVLALLVGVVVAGTMAVYHEVVDPLYHADRWTEVTPDRLYRSAEPPALAVRAMMDEHGFDEVIKLTGDASYKLRHRKEYEAAEALGIEVHEIGMGGNGVAPPERYADALERIDRAIREGRKTLVHCAAGTHRTGGVVAAYRMLMQGWPADAAFREMQAHNFSHTHNYELVPYLNENLPVIARLLAERGVLPRVPERIEKINPN